MKKECFIIRCIDIKDAELGIYNTLREKYSDKDIFFTCDSDIKDQNNTISLSRFVDKFKLKVNVDKLGWLCGDHCFYATFNKRPDYDYYWLIEPDVHIDSVSLSALTLESKNKKEDLLISDLSKADKNWFWYKKYQKHYPKHIVFKGFFPIVRLSNKAVQFAFNERINLASRQKSRAINYPNDESFICSILINNGFTSSKLECSENNFFNNTAKLKSEMRVGQLAHPCFYDAKTLLRREEKYIKKAIKNKQEEEYKDFLFKQNNYNKEIMEAFFNSPKKNNKKPNTWRKLIDLIYNRNLK